MSCLLTFYSGKPFRLCSYEQHLIFYRTVQLFTGSWGFRNNWLGNWHDRVPLISKVFSVIFPGLIIGLLSVQSITNNVGAFIVVAYISSKCARVKANLFCTNETK